MEMLDRKILIVLVGIIGFSLGLSGLSAAVVPMSRTDASWMSTFL